jgi:protein-S-isoprenylcysteine O-methyltransferase Ste14
MPSPRERRRRTRQEEDHPPGRYISGAVIALAILSLLVAAVAPFLGALGIPFAVSGFVSAVGFAAVWAVLKNLRELNAALNDEYEDSDSG